MKKLIYYIAMSADGFIAHTNGSVDGLLMEGPHADDFQSALDMFDTVLMGKETYKFGFKYGLKAGQVPYKGLSHLIFSNESLCANTNVLEIVNTGDSNDKIQILKQTEGKNAWLCGGGQLAGFLLEEKQIDEIILKINPVIFGDGIRLFNCINKKISLKLLKTKTYHNGVLLSHYSVNYEG